MKNILSALQTAVAQLRLVEVTRRVRADYLANAATPQERAQRQLHWARIATSELQ